MRALTGWMRRLAFQRTVREPSPPCWERAETKDTLTTNNFMENAAALLLGSALSSRQLLANALFGIPAEGFLKLSAGQYDPGRAGGFNQGEEIETNTPTNPWDFVLTLEGAAAWAGGLYRRQGVSYRSFLCSPFTVRATLAGYGSAAGKDGDAARAEIWTPTWNQPARYAEIKAMLREGRASLEIRPARTGLEFAQAACGLGVDRGISGFVRYSLLKRRGDSYVALPTGEFPVGNRTETDLIRELSGVLEDVDQNVRDKPILYGSLRRQVDDAIFTTLLKGGSENLREALRAFGRLHRYLLLTEKPARLNSRLSTRWIDQCGDSPELRTAAALAWMHDAAVGALRRNLTRADKQFAWFGRALPDRMISVLDRRLLVAQREGIESNPLASAYRASLRDVGRFIEGMIDDDILEDLVFALLLTDWSGYKQMPTEYAETDIWPAYALLKHLFLDNTVTTHGEKLDLCADRRITGLLSGGHIADSCRIAIQRLRIAGLPVPDVEHRDNLDGRRLGAALLIPVSWADAVGSLRRAALRRSEAAELA